MKRYTLAAVAALLVVIPSRSPVRADAQLYTVDNLGSFNGLVPAVVGINAGGQIAGNVGPGSKAVRYGDGAWHTLPGLETGFSSAFGINSAGDVVGYRFTADGIRAFRYRDGFPVDDIQPVTPGDSTVGFGINDAGTVVGQSGMVAFRADIGVAPVALPSLGGSSAFACGINNGWQVAGVAQTVSEAQHGMRVDFGAPFAIDIAGFDGAAGTVTTCAIDADGRVGGQSSRSGKTHAFLYTAAGAVDIDTFNSNESNVEAIAGGVAVGWYTVSGGARRALAHTDADGTFDLNTRIDAPGWVLNQAKGVNAAGVIVGTGTFNGAPAVFRLTPLTSVKDTTPPVIAPHADQTAEASSPAGAVVAYSAPATSDAVDGNGTATCAPASGSVFSFGTTTVTCNASDAAGNVAAATTFTVTVSDTTAPVIAAHFNQTAEATGPGGAAVGYNAPTTSDAVDGNRTATCAPASGSAFPLGATTVTCNASDAAGNAAVATTFTVTVTDTTAPVIAAHADQTANATGPGGAVVLYSAPATSDAVDGARTATCAPASGSAFPLGTTAVTCHAADMAGNVAAATTFRVTVKDNTAPAITSIGASPAAVWPPNGKPVLVSLTVSATDNVDTAPACSLTSVSGGGMGDAVITGQFSATVRANGGTVYVLGVTCSDAAGNNSTATTTVAVTKDSAASPATKTPKK